MSFTKKDKALLSASSLVGYCASADNLRTESPIVNQWIDGHPEVEIKFVTSTVGLYEGKIKEPALICQ